MEGQEVAALQDLTAKKKHFIFCIPTLENNVNYFTEHLSKIEYDIYSRNINKP